MKTQAIEVEGFPEGYKTSNFRYPIIGEKCWSPIMGVYIASASDTKCFIVEKIQPRRIVLEEISKEEYHMLFNDERCSDIYNMRGSYWREVKEIDIPLNSDEPKLSLRVDECRNIITGSNRLGLKIDEFIKENS